MRYALSRLGRWTGTLLMAAGIVILVGTLGLYGYGQYEEWQTSREAARIVPVVPTPPPTSVPTAPAAPTIPPPEASPNRAVSAASTPLPTATPVPIVSTPTPDPTPVGPAPAKRIVAPSIGLDTIVVEAPIVDGEWTVPKFVAGHLEGTAQPLQGGNVVLSGHVESISSGNVFANLDHLKPGDKILVYTTNRIVTYVVHQTLVVKNDDMSVVQPQGRETLTLITCSGNWLPLKNDYDRRFVVVANLAS